jgi:signal transduction histidine kinase
VKYGAGKPIQIAIACEGGRARLTVIDHGVGMTAEEQTRIFNKVEHTVIAHHHAGLGLGLWLARRIVAAHRGSIGVQSRSGEGSAFTIELPLALLE